MGEHSWVVDIRQTYPLSKSASVGERQVKPLAQRSLHATATLTKLLAPPGAGERDR
jgi:hypothetical protein